MAEPSSQTTARGSSPLRDVATFLLPVFALMGLVSGYPVIRDALVAGQWMDALYALADALDTASILVVALCGTGSWWILPAAFVLIVRGVGTLTGQLHIGLFSELPGQHTVAGWILIGIASLLLILFVVDRVIARTSNE